jgi:spermidine synthase
MSGPYHLLLLTAFSLAGYSLTYLLVRTGILTRLQHRQIWNIVLLVSFFISGILGIMLVIQLNYKLEWPFMKPLMVWHVDAGILLCLVAFIHFIWHFSYYIRIFPRKPRPSPPQSLPSVNREQLYDLTPFILVSGFYATVVQVLMIRELTTVFQGNELMMGWTLGVWMLLTGAGAWAGRSPKASILRQNLERLLILLSWIPVIAVLATDLGKNLLFPAGELVHPFLFMIIILLLLSPVCLLTGFAYSGLVSLTGTEEKSFVRVYALESVGSIAGGFAVTFLLIRWLSVIQALLLTGLIIHLAVLRARRTTPMILSGILILALLTSFLLFPLDLRVKSFLFPNQHLITSRETPGGNVSVCENSGEYSFYENGAPLFTTGDVIINEEYTHYALLQHPEPRQVLLISGGAGGMTEEIIKYPSVLKIDLVELNPTLFRLSESFRPLPADPRIRIHPGDGRRFVSRTASRPDVVILAVPDPSSLQINRYFTSEFFSMLRQKMADNGVILMGLSPSGNYLSPEKTAVESVLYHTLRQHFRNIVIIPSERDYFIASDGPLSDQPWKSARLRGIKTSFVNPDYLDDIQIAERSRLIRQKIGEEKLVNTDQRPLPVFYHSLQFLTRFFGRNFYLMPLPLILLLLPLLLMNPVSGSMYITGFSASSAEIMLIFWFQTFFGNVYSAIGIIFAIFMAGLVAGSYGGTRLKSPGNSLVPAQVILGLFLLFLPLLWSAPFRKLSDAGAWALFVPVLLIPSFLAGFQYVASTLRYDANRNYAASSIYAADLWGSALGIILITFILVPVYGIRNCSWILAALNGLSALLLLLHGKFKRP